MRPCARLLCTLVRDCQTTRVAVQCVQPVGGLMQTGRLLPTSSHPRPAVSARRRHVLALALMVHLV